MAAFAVACPRRDPPAADPGALGSDPSPVRLSPPLASGGAQPLGDLVEDLQQGASPPTSPIATSKGLRAPVSLRRRSRGLGRRPSTGEPRAARRRRARSLSPASDTQSTIIRLHGRAPQELSEHPPKPVQMPATQQPPALPADPPFLRGKLFLALLAGGRTSLEHQAARRIRRFTTHPRLCPAVAARPGGRWSRTWRTTPAPGRTR